MGERFPPRITLNGIEYLSKEEHDQIMRKLAEDLAKLNICPPAPPTNILNPVELKPFTVKWQVWMEGYKSRGERGSAHLIATVEAENWSEACLKAVKEFDPNTWQKNFDPHNLSYWGCRLYDNEEDARFMFG